MDKPEVTLVIREYVAATDKPGLRRCVEALQDFERVLVPSMPKGSDIGESYVADILKKCATYSGKVFVLANDSANETEVSGYVTIYTRMTSDEIDDGTEEFAHIGDLMVLEQYRALGYGRKLLAKAESVAVSAGSRKLRIGVLAENVHALQLYESLSFKPFAVQLQKEITVVSTG